MYEFVAAEDLRLVEEWQSQGRIVVTTFNVVFDESGKKDRSHVIYAGFVFHPDRWNEFSRLWRGLMYPYGINVFHAKEAFAFAGEWKRFRNRSDERDNLLRSLASLSQGGAVEGHASIVRTDDFNRMPKALRNRYKNDPFYCAFEQGIKAALENAEVLPTDNFNLLCDDSEESAGECLRVYRQFRKDYPHLAKKVGFIAFGDDEKFPAIQMADMWASCIRRREEGAPDGIWRELLEIFMPSDNPDMVVRPMVLRRGDYSRWALFRRRFGLFRQAGRNLWRS